MWVSKHLYSFVLFKYIWIAYLYNKLILSINRFLDRKQVFKVDPIAIADLR